MKTFPVLAALDHSSASRCAGRTRRRRSRAAGTATGHARPGEPCASADDDPPSVAARQQFERVPVTAGRSTIVPTDFAITRIAITNPEVADAVVVQPREILIDGKKAGTVSLIVWGGGSPSAVRHRRRAGNHHARTASADAVPRRSYRRERQRRGGRFCPDRCRARHVMLRAGEIARASSAKTQVINMLQVPGGNESQQVMLQVRFAEVNRRALTELGLSLFVIRNRFAARSTTQQFSRARLRRREPEPPDVQ